MQNKNEINAINSELKMKQKMLSTMEEKIKKVEGPAEIADQLIEKIKVTIIHFICFLCVIRISNIHKNYYIK